ncbi:mannose-ethanolamine phosphotransferase gpi13 [Teratosphaeriaceae sp. CCFEE 6253]|nr:mannose-ethanolamine phosphotransferase gpi13 [Teratosphaeriaceae sp. CCFEE 6253]
MEDERSDDTAAEELKAQHKRIPVQWKAQHALVVAFFLLLFVFHALGIYLFCSGFLLSRLVLPDRSQCNILPTDVQQGYVPGSINNGCWHPKSFDKAVVILVDALRYDFTVPFQPRPGDEQPHYFHNALPVLYETSVAQPNNAFLRPFIADPPTTTTLRLKGLTTGTLPTFIDAGSNFAGTAIDEDNLIEQLYKAGKKVVHIGDDTWHSLFPGYFEPNLTQPFDSFNVWDLHTVDNGVNAHLFPLLTPAMQGRWDVIIGHYLGVDHAGHRYGPDHPAMHDKLAQMNGVIRRMIAELDDSTLLVVMGDHGMDVKGDHGGESDDEVQAALWMYSKRPVFGSRDADSVRPPLTAKERAVGQIDLVPTLAFLLGLPVPFNNLGQPIAEAFLGPRTDYDNLARVNRLTAAQIHQYQGYYAKARGLDEAATSSTSREWQEANTVYHNAHNASWLSTSPGARDIADAFAAYQVENLRICRDLWARFDLVSMAMGIAALLGACAILAIYAHGIGADRATLTPLLLGWGVAGTVGGAAVGAVVGAFPSLSLIQLSAFGAAMGGTGATLVGLWPARKILRAPVPRTFWGGLCFLVTLLLCVGFASNSFTIWEDEQLLSILTTFGVLMLSSSLGQDLPEDRVLGVANSVSFLAATRLSSMSRLCREEQMPDCRSTYYASATSSTSAEWQLIIPVVVLAALPSAIASFFGRTRNYQGIAVIWIGYAMRAGLALVALFWILDAADDNEWTTRLSKETLKTSRVLIAQVVLALAFAGGYAIYVMASPLLDVKNEDARPMEAPATKQSEPVQTDEPIFTSMDDVPNKPKPRLIIFGYANTHGTRYFLLPCAWILALQLLQKPMGQGALALCLVSILNLLEILDANDLRHTALGPTLLALLGNFYFFKTGHQAALATIQWESAFIPLKAITYPWSPLFVTLNTFGAQILCAIAVPAISLWKVPPKQQGLLGRISGGMATHVLFHAAIAVATVLEAAWLRRHLMLYRVFMPRMLLAIIVLLLVEIVGALVALLGVRWAIAWHNPPPHIQATINSLALPLLPPPPMAGQPPDPRTFDTWEDAFQYPLPVVRKLEQQLRRQLEDNRQKLRALVGASYRDLLGTAERIIEMDGQIRMVEERLGGVGRQCSARAVERVGDNHARMRAGREDGEREGNRAMVQTKVLQSALTACTRTMRARGDALLVAKLLVLARVLHKRVSEGVGAPDMIGELGRKLAMLRKKLLAYIERSLARPAADRHSLARTLCAYALVSSSSPRDVLRHFLQVRLREIESKAEVATEATILQVLESCHRTLVDSRALFPKLFTESLAQLGTLPLVQDAQVKALHELNLDIYGAWLAPDVQGFTPWVRHEQLSASEVNDGLSAWSKQAQECTVGAVTAYLESETDAHAILSVRKKVLSQYLAMAARRSDASHSHAIENLRSVFLARLSRLAELRAQEGAAVFEDINLAASPPPGAGDLWQLASQGFDASHGAAQLRQAVLDRRHGRDERLRTICQRLDAWVHNLGAFWDLTQQMRATRWNDDADVDFDDPDDGEALLDTLTKRDPEQLRTGLREATREAIEHIYATVQRASDAGSNAALLLRLLREIHHRQRTLAAHLGIGPNTSSHDTFATLATSLHQKFAASVSDTVLKQHAAPRGKHVGIPLSLWEGAPALPVQPSPATHRVLSAVQRGLGEVGGDVWSPDAVGALKTVLDGRLAERLGEGATGGDHSEPVVNGHAAKDDETGEEADAVNPGPVVNGEPPVDDRRRHQQLQLLFDVLYLQAVLHHQPSHEGEGGGGALQDLAAQLTAKLHLDMPTSERLRKSAGEYWRKTYLLFGLLAPHG